MRYRFRGDDVDRYAPRTHGVRIIEAFEAMRFAGWSDHFWSAQHPNAQTIEDLETWVNVSGNSYYVFHWVPWFCSLLSTYGRYRMAPEDRTSVESAGDDADDGDADSIDPPDSE